MFLSIFDSATLIQDFCTVVGRENPATLFPHELTFIRHITDPIDSPPVCPVDQEAEDVPYLKMGQNTCDTITVNEEDTNPDSEEDTYPVDVTDPDSSAFFTSATHTLALSILAVVGNLLA